MHHVLGISEAVEEALGRLQHTIRQPLAVSRGVSIRRVTIDQRTVENDGGPQNSATVSSAGGNRCAWSISCVIRPDSPGHAGDGCNQPSESATQLQGSARERDDTLLMT